MPLCLSVNTHWLHHESLSKINGKWLIVFGTLIMRTDFNQVFRACLLIIFFALFWFFIWLIVLCIQLETRFVQYWLAMQCLYRSHLPVKWAACRIGKKMNESISQSDNESNGDNVINHCFFTILLGQLCPWKYKLGVQSPK